MSILLIVDPLQYVFIQCSKTFFRNIIIFNQFIGVFTIFEIGY